MKFKVGDRVKIINAGSRYTTYHKWVRLHKLTKFVEHSSTAIQNQIGTVIAMGHHEVCIETEIAGVKLDHADEEIVIGTTGLSLTDSPKPKEETNNHQGMIYNPYTNKYSWF